MQNNFASFTILYSNNYILAQNLQENYPKETAEGSTLKIEKDE